MRRHLPIARGVTLVELMISMTVLTIGMLGMAQMQLVAVRSKEMGHNTALASALSHDLAENMSSWRYNDSRLAASDTITSLGDTKVSSRLNLPPDVTLDSSLKFDFAEAPSDANATTSSALGTAYQGTRGDVKVTGKLDFVRYWSVYNFNPGGAGKENGKLIVVVTRWREAGLGMRQVATTVFKANEEVYSL